MYLTEEQKQKIRVLAEEYGITNVRVFGSYARGEATSESDIDLLVDFGANNLTGISGFKIDLEESLNKKVDVAEDSGVYWFIRDEVLKEARPL